MPAWPSRKATTSRFSTAMTCGSRGRSTHSPAVIASLSPSIVTASVIEFSDEARLAQVSDMPVRHRAFADVFSASGLPISVGSGTAVIRRTTFLASGGFTDRSINAEDHDLILRLGDAAGFAQMLEPITFAWRQHAASLTRQLDRSIAGTSYLIQQEQAGKYPAVERRGDERRRIITRHVRPITFACLRERRPGAAFDFTVDLLVESARRPLGLFGRVSVSRRVGVIEARRVSAPGLVRHSDPRPRSAGRRSRENDRTADHTCGSADHGRRRLGGARRNAWSGFSGRAVSLVGYGSRSRLSEKSRHRVGDRRSSVCDRR